MLEEAFEWIKDSTRQPIVCLAPEPGHCYHELQADGGYKLVEAKPKPRQYRALSISGLVSLCDLMSVSDVFVGVRAVDGIVDEHGLRRESCRFDLYSSDQYSVLNNGGVSYTQDQLYALLTRVLRDCLVDETLLPKLRHLKFKTKSDGSREVATGTAAWGSDVEQAVLGADGGMLPEIVEFRIPVYSNVPNPIEPYFEVLRCSLLVNLEERKFQLKPLPGELERSLALVRARLCSDLAHMLKQHELLATVHPDSEFRVSV